VGQERLGPSYFFISLVLSTPLNSLLWYVPSLRYIELSSYFLFLQEQIKDIVIIPIAWERAEGGRWQRHCASTPRLRRSTLAGMTWERAQGGCWQRPCASTPQLRCSTLASIAWERAEGGRWQRHCASTPRLRRSTLGAIGT
jgi:hypothetical protein